VTTTEAAPPAAPDTARHVARRRWRRSRGILVVVLALVVIGVVLAALRPKVRPEFLDPDSPGQQGTRALAEITRQHGTPVTVVRDVSAAANELGAHPDAVLVIARSERLGRADLTTLRALPGDRLLLEPTSDTLDALAPGVEQDGVTSGTLDPGCPLPAASAAGPVALIGAEVYKTPAGATRCYIGDGRPSLVQLPVNGANVTVVGSGEPFTNERLTSDGDAALGINLLGSRSNVVWLLPDPPPPGAAGHKSFTELVPFGVKLAFLQTVIAVVLVALWRARRLGPVVVEPLPVVVRSAEAVEGRARLYRSRRAGDRAAMALRAGALERLTALLGMPKSAASDPAMANDIIAGIAAHTGEAHATIGAALYGPPPVDDAELVRLSGYLDELERQVRSA
jgi:Domain of unknown function (DUF4350)